MPSILLSPLVLQQYMVQAHTQQMRQRTRTPPPIPPPIAAAFVTTAESMNKSGCEQISLTSINIRASILDYKVKSSLCTKATSYLGFELYELSHIISQCSSVSFNSLNWSRYNYELQLQGLP